MYGKSGEDLTIAVPIGTLIRDAKTGIVLADLVENGEPFIAAKGGGAARATPTSPPPPARRRILPSRVKPG